MSITECFTNELPKCKRQLTIRKNMPSYDYLDSVKTYYIEICEDEDCDGTENYMWSLVNPHSNGFCPVHEKPVSMNNPKVTLAPSFNTRACSVTVDPGSLFRTASSITVYVWNACDPAEMYDFEGGAEERQTSKISVSEIYVFKK
ncbi:MAG: hypothetical protein J5798_12330 [Spirochaetaceae bacterium]|nr:hypothetical protein [Spirochaetaceae bacterium]